MLYGTPNPIYDRQIQMDEHQQCGCYIAIDLLPKHHNEISFMYFENYLLRVCATGEWKRLFGSIGNDMGCIWCIIFIRNL